MPNRKYFNLSFVLIILFLLSSCTGMKTLSKDEILNVQHNSKHHKQDRAQKLEAIALEYHDQGGYKKAAELNFEAAELYQKIKSKKDERRVVLNEMKVLLKCSKREEFISRAERLEAILGKLRMPERDEQFLLNLAARMRGDSLLPYPVPLNWRYVFNQ